MLGFLDPDAEEEDVAAAATHIGSELSEEDLADEDSDLETEMTLMTMKKKKKIQALIQNLPKKNLMHYVMRMKQANKVISSKGRGHADAEKAIDAIAEVFKEFRLVPKVFDRLVKNMRDVMDRLRVQERLIMKHCVVGAGMPKATFHQNFPRK